MKGQTREHGPLTVRQFPCLSDNYGFLVRDGTSGRVAAVDAPDAQEIVAQADALGWRIDEILNTHWHPDHTGGNEALVQRYGCAVVGPAAEADRIPGITRQVGEGDEVHVGEVPARVIATPGHTLGHVAFVFDRADVAFVGDAMFSLGCGRLFEGEPAQMWESLKAVRALPAETVCYCAHEYTRSNAAFAVTVDPGNEALAARKREVDRLREADEPTVPVRLSEEVRTNPFLRADVPALAEGVGMAGASPEAVFAEIRRRKDQF